MSQVLGPLQQAVYVYSRFEPLGKPGQRGNEPERAWPHVPAPAARIQASTSAASTGAGPTAAANAWRVSSVISPSDAKFHLTSCANSIGLYTPARRDRCHAWRSTHRWTVVLAVWWTGCDAISDF